jgi:hypothetical protein
MKTEYESSRLTEKERYFREFSVWPVYADFDSEGWLSNFHRDERNVAERLLTNFTYFNERMTDALLRASVQQFLVSTSQSDPNRYGKGLDYLRETAFVICEGESPNPTDSGHVFARKLRDRLSISESNIFWPLNALLKKDCFKRYVFVDDFTGSGNQFIETWNRVHQVDGTSISFKGISEQGSASFAYCCCIATQKARQAIHAAAPGVLLAPAHQLSERHSAIHSHSGIWVDFDAGTAREKIRQASARAGYTAEDQGQNDWRGFHALGLSLAFSHGIPDACLPIYFSQRNGWKPLVVRS